ncbi:MAG: methionyl-tRNA formyltransferase [Deltaproteobacteria bacterium]|nr:methionyl-tRNA formyltransferase [Deltaproteobacteria bacterium]
MTDRLKLLFMGSPDFAVPALRAVAERHQLLAVVTQPDRPKGRGRALTAPPVKVAAADLGVPVLQPERLRGRRLRLELMAFDPDAIIVVAYGQILSPRLIAGPRLGCINVHASLLPKYRGAAPIQWALLNGDAQSGVSIMRIERGLDAGAVLLQRTVDCAPDETSATLHDRLAELGAAALLDGLERISAGSAVWQAQDDEAATYARPLQKSDGAVDFRWSAKRVDSWIRGMDPWPGAFCRYRDQPLKLFASREQADVADEPGRVVAIDQRGLLVACQRGGVWIAALQSPGKRRMVVSDWLAGKGLAVGETLASVENPA